MKIGEFGERGKILETFSPHDEIDLLNLLNNIDCGICLSIKISLPFTTDFTFHLLRQ